MDGGGKYQLNLGKNMERYFFISFFFATILFSSCHFSNKMIVNGKSIYQYNSDCLDVNISGVIVDEFKYRFVIFFNKTGIIYPDSLRLTTSDDVHQAKVYNISIEDVNIKSNILSQRLLLVKANEKVEFTMMFDDFSENEKVSGIFKIKASGFFQCNEKYIKIPDIEIRLK